MSVHDGESCWGGDGLGGGGDGDGGDGLGGGGDGDGGDGLGGGGEGGGTGQAVWQTYFFFLVQVSSFHLPLALKFMQSSPLFPYSLNSPPAQLVYDSGVFDGHHTHLPSDAASVPPIHNELPAAAVSSSAFCAADCTLANWRPAV